MTIAPAAAAPPDEPVLWWGNTPAAWIGAAIAIVVVTAAVYLTMRLLRRHILPHARTSPRAPLVGLAALIDAIRLRYLGPIIVIVVVDFLALPPRVAFWLRIAGYVLVGLQIVLALNRFMVAALERVTRPEPGGARPVMVTIVTWSIQLVVWVAFALAIIGSFGINITTFVASLGVGGIAVALALQNILGDLFASIAIGLDKPFGPGEYISFDEGEGTISHIGVKSTRIVSVTGEELAIANSKLLQKLTHNYSRMAERRIGFGFTVPYSTTREQLAALTARANSAIRAAHGVRFDRGHVKGFGVDGFELEFVYHVLTSDFTVYRDVHQQIVGEIIDSARDLGIPFAVPGRRVDVQPPLPPAAD